MSERSEPPRIQPSDPLPGYQEPSGRWAIPYRAFVDGQYVYTVALRYGVELSTRERLSGLSPQLYAETPEELQRLMEREDAAAERLRTSPPVWTETGSGPPTDSPWRGGDGRAGGSAGSSVGP